MPTLCFEGTVYSGKGVGKTFVALSWVTAQIESKLGFSPYQGTLNLRLTEEGKNKRKFLAPEKGITITPQASYLPGVAFRASIDGFECAVILPLVPNYPADVLEIISPLYLRGKLGLGDGKKVTVWVTVS
jgi:riboflavin kinase, archaea type